MMDSREHLHDKGTYVLTASMLSDEYLLFTHSISVFQQPQPALYNQLQGKKALQHQQLHLRLAQLQML